MSIYPSTLEAIYGPELVTILSEMEECFPPLTVSIDQPIQSIMFRAGQRSVVEWLINRINNEEN
jgi:hypothetical protein